MKKLILLLFVSSSLFAQKIKFSGKLADKETSEPIVYANISFLDSNKGISTTEEGAFSMNLSKKYLNSKIHISCLNYKDTIVLAKDIYNKTLFLKPINVVLDEIFLTKILEKTSILGQVKKDVQGIHTSGMRMIAKYFPNDKRSECCNYLSELEIHFSKRSSHQKKSKFRIRVFSKDKKTGLPKKDILNVNLPVEIKKGDLKTIIDISAYNLEMPENGVFIAFEKLFIPFNEYGKNDLDAENEFFYSPMIGYTKYKKKDRNDNMYHYVKGKWRLSPLAKIKRLKKVCTSNCIKIDKLNKYTITQHKMFTEYKNLPNNSRVWIYQSDREFTDKEIEFIGEKAEDFINQWTRHGDDLKGSFTIKYNQFLVLAVDESFNNVSGCSIDSSVRFVQELETALQLDLMDKMNITFKDNESINLVKLPDFQRFAKEQKVTAETIVFNNMVNTKEDFENNWEVPAKESWHKRFLV